MENQLTQSGGTVPAVVSDALLGLGLFVIESRSRNRDKSLGPWKPAAAFPLEGNAVAYLNQYESIGYMRLRRPNASGETRPVCGPFSVAHG